MSYTLDERVENSSFHIKDFSLCEARLKNHKDHLWIVLIPKVSPSITELYELSEKNQAIIMAEITAVSRIIKKYAGADKINVAAIGNVVSQLHIHIIARHHNDLLWPQSLWQSQLIEKPYDPTQKEKIITDLCVLFA